MKNNSYHGRPCHEPSSDRCKGMAEPVRPGNRAARKNDAPVVEMAAGVLSRHPYPGDVDERANQWVTETALDLIAHYDPDLVCLSYVQQFFSDRHFNHPEMERKRLFTAAMEEAGRFVDQSGFTPVIVGTGDMIPLGRGYGPVRPGRPGRVFQLVGPLLWHTSSQPKRRGVSERSGHPGADRGKTGMD